MPRRDLAGFATASEGIGRRMRLLQRTRPDRDRAELEVTALPAKGLRLGPGFEDQLHRLGGALARLGRVETVAQILAGDAAQQADPQAPRHQIVEHRQIFGDLHRVALRYDRAEHRDLYLLRMGREVGGRDGRGRRQPMRGIVVLGDADPVEPQALDELHPLDHAAIGLHSGVAVIGVGRHRPFCRQSARRAVMRGLEKRDFHGGELRTVRRRGCAVIPSRQRVRATASGARCRGRRGSGRRDRAHPRRPPRGSA